MIPTKIDHADGRSQVLLMPESLSECGYKYQFCRTHRLEYVYDPTFNWGCPECMLTSDRNEQVASLRRERVELESLLEIAGFDTATLVRFNSLEKREEALRQPVVRTIKASSRDVVRSFAHDLVVLCLAVVGFATLLQLAFGR